MRSNQTSKLFHSKGSHKQNKKTVYRLKEYICKWCNQQGLNFQNMQTIHTIQQQNKTKQNNPPKQPNWKLDRRPK